PRSLPLPDGPPDPSPTATPTPHSSGTRPTPLAIIMLLDGLYTHPTCRCAKVLRSAPSTKMQCADTTSGPSTPILSRYCTGDIPCCFWLSSHSFFISATWIRIGA